MNYKGQRRIPGQEIQLKRHCLHTLLQSQILGMPFRKKSLESLLNYQEGIDST